jgi:flagellar assembly protein FliH
MSSLQLLARGAPRGFSADRRFSAIWTDEPELAVPVVDPLEEAFAQGRAEGFAEAMALAEARELETEAARARIELAFARLDEHSAAELRERLRVTVLALCEEAVAPLAVDPVGLALRIERAISVLQRKQDECVLRLHPDDFALVHDRLPTSLATEPDPAMERGALRIETADGGVEDGPTRWRAILAEAFGEC